MLRYNENFSFLENVKRKREEEQELNSFFEELENPGAGIDAFLQTLEEEFEPSNDYEVEVEQGDDFEDDPDFEDNEDDDDEDDEDDYDDYDDEDDEDDYDDYDDEDDEDDYDDYDDEDDEDDYDDYDDEDDEDDEDDDYEEETMYPSNEDFGASDFHSIDEALDFINERERVPARRKRKKVIRGGKVVVKMPRGAYIKKRPTAAQRRAWKKNLKKTRTASAKLNRKKSNRLRKRRGL